MAVILAFLPLVLLIFWMFRVPFAIAYKMYRGRSMARVSAAET
jgi:hypothetical protein